MGDVRLQRGVRVNCKCADGRTAENVVWEDLGDVVMVCSRFQFDRLERGYPSPMPIGFYRADVSPLTQSHRSR